MSEPVTTDDQPGQDRRGRVDPDGGQRHRRRLERRARHAARRASSRRRSARVGGVKADVTGMTAGSKDFNDSMKSHLPIVFAFVLGLAFLLLLVTFRSIVVPIKAIVLNLLSVGAAYGDPHARLPGRARREPARVRVDRRDHRLAAAVPVRDPVRPVDGLPRVHPQPDPRGGRPRDEAPTTPSRYGIKQTAGVVTSAAVVMVAVFSIFGSLSMVEFKMMGVGLAAAVLIDATLVRGVLLPAAMKLLGEWNWYLPKRLDWLPKISHEHELPEPAQRVGDLPAARREGGPRPVCALHAAHAHRRPHRRRRLPRPQRGHPRHRPQGHQPPRPRVRRLPLRLGGRAQERGDRAHQRRPRGASCTAAARSSAPRARTPTRSTAASTGSATPSMRQRDLDALIPIGGEDTLGVARRLVDEGINVVGVPKTIDNDLAGTDFTFGFHTAVQIATDAIDRLHTTAESHNRVIVVEVMGRHAGWIAAYSGIAGGADVILVPERPFDIDEVCSLHQAPPRRGRDVLDRRRRRGRHAQGRRHRHRVRRRDRRVRPRAPRRHRGRAREGDRGAHRLRDAHDDPRPRAARRHADRLRPRARHALRRRGDRRGRPTATSARWSRCAGTEIVRVPLDEALAEPKLLDPRLYETAESSSADSTRVHEVAVRLHAAAAVRVDRGRADLDGSSAARQCLVTAPRQPHREAGAPPDGIRNRSGFASRGRSESVPRQPDGAAATQSTRMRRRRSRSTRGLYSSGRFTSVRAHRRASGAAAAGAVIGAVSRQPLPRHRTRCASAGTPSGRRSARRTGGRGHPDRPPGAAPRRAGCGR